MIKTWNGENLKSMKFEGFKNAMWRNCVKMCFVSEIFRPASAMLFGHPGGARTTFKSHIFGGQRCASFSRGDSGDSSDINLSSKAFRYSVGGTDLRGQRPWRLTSLAKSLASKLPAMPLSQISHTLHSNCRAFVHFVRAVLHDGLIVASTGCHQLVVRKVHQKKWSNLCCWVASSHQAFKISYLNSEQITQFVSCKSQ